MKEESSASECISVSHLTEGPSQGVRKAGGDTKNQHSTNIQNREIEVNVHFPTAYNAITFSTSPLLPSLAFPKPTHFRESQGSENSVPASDTEEGT